MHIAHIDCDAFYAAVEKRDNPELRDKPVLVGGATRGVVTTACYIARKYGPRSAMPMYKALALCPQAVVIRPDMAKYKRVSQQIRKIFDAATPIVEPLSLDEAFLDLAGTSTLFGRTPAATLAHVAREIERTIRITVSIGLSYNKFLAKIASDFDKPRGFYVIGRADAVQVLHDLPLARLPGVGPSLADRIKVDGLFTVGDVQRKPESRWPCATAIPASISPNSRAASTTATCATTARPKACRRKPPSIPTSPTKLNSAAACGLCASGWRTASRRRASPAVR